MSKLQKILIKAKREIFSEMSGNNPSVFQGEGYDFVELREYMAGDDIRHIDWKITAKMQKPYIKIYKQERELNVVLVSVLNGSVHFGSHRLKQECIADIVAHLGFATLKNGDLLGTYIFTDTLKEHNKPSKKNFLIHKSVEDVLEFKALNESCSLSNLSHEFYTRLKRKSLIIVIGDFFELPEWKLLAKKHEVLAVIVRDKFEENPPAMGLASLVDPQSAQTLEGNFDKASVEAYANKVKEHDALLYKKLKNSGIRFVKIYTDELVSVGLKRLFKGK